MPRATIPYDALQAKLETMFPSPTYRVVRLLRPKRGYSSIKAPTTVYDRRSGNFKKIGYRCEVYLDRFTGLTQDLSRTLWTGGRETVIVEL